MTSSSPEPNSQTYLLLLVLGCFHLVRVDGNHFEDASPPADNPAIYPLTSTKSTVVRLHGTFGS